MLFQTNLVGFGKRAGLSTVISLSGPWGAKPHLAGTGGGFPPGEMCVPTVMFPCGSECGGRCRYGSWVWSEEFKIPLLSLVLWVVDLGTERDPDI